MDPIAEVTRDAGPHASLVRAVLDAAAGEPLLLPRARLDPALEPIREALLAASEHLARLAAEGWDEAAERLERAREATEAWVLLAGADAAARFGEIDARRRELEERAAGGEPFAVLAAAEEAAALADRSDELRERVRLQVQEEIAGRRRALEERVEGAGPELKATQEWVDAHRVAGELAAMLERAGGEDDEAARVIVDEVRHHLAVQEDLLDVTELGIARREREMTRRREHKHAEDRAVLKLAEDRFPVIHLQLLATVVLACLLVWIVQMLPAAMLPAAFALLRARSARAMLRQRRWSVPRADVDAVEERLASRMIVAVLLMVGIVIEMVILWMAQSI